MARWSKAAGAGIGFYLGGPAGALLGYFIGRAMGTRISSRFESASLAPYYETLKVSPTANMEEIKRSYRNLVKKYHPDLQGGIDGKRKVLLEKKMAKINEAYGKIRRARNSK
jgi:preprotein translocase subunit Sec63